MFRLCQTAFGSVALNTTNSEANGFIEASLFLILPSSKGQYTHASEWKREHCVNAANLQKQKKKKS